MKNVPRFMLSVARLVVAVASTPGLVSAQLADLPLRIVFDRGTREVAAGAPSSLRILLKNYQGQDVAAPEDIKVKIGGLELGRDLDVVIPKGQSSVKVPIVVSHLGVTRLRATSPSLAPAQSILLVTPSSPHATVPKASTDVEVPIEQPKVLETLEHKVHAATPPVAAVVPEAAAPALASMPPAQLPGDANLRLQLEVPDSVAPEDGHWRADVMVYVANQQGVPCLAPSGAVVDLIAQKGTVSPPRVQIPAGQFSSRDQAIELTSTRDGTDRLTARSTLGNAEKAVVYESPRPTRLLVSPSPKTVVNNGKNEISISVTLRDDQDRPASFSDRDLEVRLSTSRGTLSGRTTKISKGSFYADDRKLQSAQSGRAEVKAEALGLAGAMDTVSFLFPWLLVSLAVVGGLVGAFVKSIKEAFSRRWLRHALTNFAVGAVMGFLAWGLAFFGAITAIPKVNINIAVIPTLNELGAFVLGFLGGFGGKAWLGQFLEPGG